MVLQALPPAYSDAMKQREELYRLRAAHDDCVCRFRQAPTAPPPRPPPIYREEYPEHVQERSMQSPTLQTLTGLRAEKSPSLGAPTGAG